MITAEICNARLENTADVAVEFMHFVQYAYNLFIIPSSIDLLLFFDISRPPAFNQTNHFTFYIYKQRS